jgi:hypothetical protein
LEGQFSGLGGALSGSPLQQLIVPFFCQTALHLLQEKFVFFIGYYSFAVQCETDIFYQHTTADLIIKERSRGLSVF